MAENRLHALLWTARIMAVCLFIACLTGWTTSNLFAQSAALDETESCVSCHEEEGMAWEDSPHGSVPPESSGESGGASCVDCHGEYIKGHPAEGPMSLSVDSSSCQGCHAETFSQWENTHHAGEGVQCISCHRPHSQALRLTDETLCQSCHRESLDDSFHTAHWQAEATCISCHMADLPNHSLANADATMGITMAAPTHDFVTVSSRNCLECHKGDVVMEQTGRKTQALPINDAATAGDTVRERRWMRGIATLSVANLGFGLGIGGVLGIVFMLVAANYGFGKKKP